MCCKSLCHSQGPVAILKGREALESNARDPHLAWELSVTEMRLQKRPRQQQQPNGLCLLHRSLKVPVVFEGPHEASAFFLQLHWESEAPCRLEAFYTPPRSTPSSCRVGLLQNQAMFPSGQAPALQHPQALPLRQPLALLLLPLLQQQPLHLPHTQAFLHRLVHWLPQPSRSKLPYLVVQIPRPKGILERHELGCPRSISHRPGTANLSWHA
mmetsp:Transcript_75009/g.165670  ORF Transcript_75009/g.165670 Transcript_75009/m.165670 type:complete len:212 (+) Transcript_75009:643-1278(+)